MDIIDEIVHVIRYEAASIDEARQILMDRWDFTDIQATEIVNMRLRQLVGLEREKLQNEYDELMKFIAHCEEVLASVELQLGIVKDETRELKEKYGDRAALRSPSPRTNSTRRTSIPMRIRSLRSPTWAISSAPRSPNSAPRTAVAWA
jgi:Type IIA topoisomerase (DNA gyrase/topo II, topoisomerase IV), A subunit